MGTCQYPPFEFSVAMRQQLIEHRCADQEVLQLQQQFNIEIQARERGYASQAALSRSRSELDLVLVQRLKVQAQSTIKFDESSNTGRGHSLRVGDRPYRIWILFDRANADICWASVASPMSTKQAINSNYPWTLVRILQSSSSTPQEG